MRSSQAPSWILTKYVVAPSWKLELEASHKSGEPPCFWGAAHSSARLPHHWGWGRPYEPQGSTQVIRASLIPGNREGTQLLEARVLLCAPTPRHKGDSSNPLHSWQGWVALLLMSWAFKRSSSSLLGVGETLITCRETVLVIRASLIPGNKGRNFWAGISFHLNKKQLMAILQLFLGTQGALHLNTTENKMSSTTYILLLYGSRGKFY